MRVKVYFETSDVVDIPIEDYNLLLDESGTCKDVSEVICKIARDLGIDSDELCYIRGEDDKIIYEN